MTNQQPPARINRIAEDDEARQRFGDEYAQAVGATSEALEKTLAELAGELPPSTTLHLARDGHDRLFALADDSSDSYPLGSLFALSPRGWIGDGAVSLPRYFETVAEFRATLTPTGPRAANTRPLLPGLVRELARPGHARRRRAQRRTRRTMGCLSRRRHRHRPRQRLPVRPSARSGGLRRDTLDAAVCDCWELALSERFPRPPTPGLNATNTDTEEPCKATSKS